VFNPAPQGETPVSYTTIEKMKETGTQTNVEGHCFGLPGQNADGRNIVFVRKLYTVW
jgi:hypothetical protein